MAEDTAIDRLSTAAAIGDLKEIQQTLQTNVNVNEKNKYGRTPLQVRLTSPRLLYLNTMFIMHSASASGKHFVLFFLAVTSSGLVDLLLTKPVVFYKVYLLTSKYAPVTNYLYFIMPIN